MADTKTPTKRSSANNIWTDEERAAMQESARERKAAARRSSSETRDDGERAVLEKIASLGDYDRRIAERLHAIITAAVPELWPRTWYGSPAYYLEGNLICFFQETAKFKARYVALGFSDKAHLDEGMMWPVGFAVKDLTPADEERVAALVRKAVS